MNFNDYVLGVCDKNYKVTGSSGAFVSSRGRRGKTGWRVSMIHGAAPVPLPFVSYTGKNVLWYADWKHTGDFGLKFNVLKSPVQVV